MFLSLLAVIMVHVAYADVCSDEYGSDMCAVTSRDDCCTIDNDFTCNSINGQICAKCACSQIAPTMPVPAPTPAYASSLDVKIYSDTTCTGSMISENKFTGSCDSLVVLGTDVFARAGCDSAGKPFMTVCADAGCTGTCATAALLPPGTCGQAFEVGQYGIATCGSSDANSASVLQLSLSAAMSAFAVVILAILS
jgi:hypothetical protein